VKGIVIKNTIDIKVTFLIIIGSHYVF